MALPAILIQLAIAVVMMVVSYALAPRPKQSSADAVRELEDPTADAGKPVGVVFGRVIVKDPNILWFGDKSTNKYKVKV